MTQNFKNLKVYGESFRLSKDLYLFFHDKKMSFRTKEQVLASASSICANLAEMAAFDSKGAIKQKVTTCIGECNETEYWLDLMHELKILPQREHIDFLGRLVKIRSMLFNLKRSVEGG
ncbi:four helix bundle protein [Candidatus Micrarchaeota archaeon]|nr:four helix bundle protein [Candidatus Micrarchaeota archaeon]MBU1681240.1 four helix bundle protein [Candidatus Micrarchaeota archaeon]